MQNLTSITQLSNKELVLKGMYTLNGDATVFDDIQVDLANIKAPAANPPTWRSYRACEVPAFSASASNVVYFKAQIPHQWLEGGYFNFHLHIANPSAAAGNSRWQLTHSWADINGEFPAETTVAVTAASPNVAHRHQIIDFGTIVGTDKHISSVLICSLTRLGGDALDTLAIELYGVSADFHYEKNSLGSREHFSK